MPGTCLADNINYPVVYHERGKPYGKQTDHSLRHKG